MSAEKPAKKSEARKPEARLPRGFADRGAAELALTRKMLETIRQVYELYGFEALETPAIEYTDALGKFLPDQDRPNEGVFSFQDDDDQWLSLRYDLTAPLARHVAENFDKIPKPLRSYRAGWVFRNEKPGPGRFRQFMQFDADIIGAPSVAADAEICMMAADTLEALGIPRGDYVIKVNNRKLLDGLLESIGLGGSDKFGQRLAVLRAIDKADKFPIPEIKKLLGDGRKDESGDFTKGAGLLENQITVITQFIQNSTGSLHLQSRVVDGQRQVVISVGTDEKIGRLIPNNNQTLDFISTTLYGNPTFDQGLEELRLMADLFQAAGYGDGRIVIDPSVVRGLEYYTGPIYEAELIFEIEDDDGKPVRFGSVAGGGRYDGLVARFRGEATPATGFSIGVSRLMAALAHLGKLETVAETGPVVVVPRTAALIPHCMGLVQRLRADAGLRAIPGFAAETYFGTGSFKGGLRYADRRRCAAAIMIGESEAEQNTAVVKDLIEGAKQASAIASNAEYRAQRLAQVTVSEADLVETVKDILARHG